MKHIHTFEGFLNEASAFNTKSLRSINFILQPFDKPYSDGFQFSFKDNANQKEIEDALKSEPNAKLAYKWEPNEFHKNRIVFTVGKDNVALTWVFKALEPLYGKYGESMGWEL